ncbi:MAG: hypothetical protein H7343_12440 [Undibacterium sp.]|nr:hypothetical protein [Opitutaceae bacterium]
MPAFLRFIVLGACGFLLAACEKKENKRAAVAPIAGPVSEPPSVPAEPRFDPVVVHRGQILHEKVLAKTSDAKLDVWGSGFPSAKACLWIPEDDWNAFSVEDREAIITYLKAQVPDIRRNPDRYTNIPSSAPVYSRIRSNIANMRDDSYIIFTMVLEGDGRWIQKRTAAESK